MENNEIRALITGFLQDKFEDVKLCWDNLPDAKKIDFYKDLLKYSVPQYSSVDAVEQRQGAYNDLEHRLQQLTTPPNKP